MTADQRAKLSNDLVRDEGVRLKAYRDSVGLWTIGVGHLLGATQRMNDITLAEAMALLDADMDAAEALAGKVFHNLDGLNDARKRVLINMCFNLGTRIGGFVKLVAAVEAANWPEAATQMMDSRWARQVGRRAVRLRDILLSGVEA